MSTSKLLFAALAAAISLTQTVSAQDKVLVLFLSKSAGYEHSCIKQENGLPSHVDNVLQKIAGEMGAEIKSTKDASLINAENLKNYKVVVFFTSGVLTIEGTDKTPPMAATGVEELLAWIRNGGGFVGYHCSSDSFHRDDNTPNSPYLDMVGGEFLTHGKQFEGKLDIVDPAHPAMANFPNPWVILDEWYAFRNLMTERMHVLALLDPREQRTEQPDKYNIPSYPVVWCSTEGQGRVYYNAMGHREDVWDNETFQKTVKDAINWARGEGPANAEPNYAKVVPTSLPEQATPAPAK